MRAASLYRQAVPSLAALPPLLLVMLGGSVGAGLRYLVGAWTIANIDSNLPFGTWTVNVVGGLLMGLLTGWLIRSGGDESLRLLLGVGVLGGFTTFSAFSLEVFAMLTRGDVVLAAAYAVSSVAGSIVALFAGAMLVRLS